MQTIKGLIALGLVAVAVFTGCLIFNRMTEPTYVTAEEKATVAETDKSPAPAAMDKTSSENTHHNTPKTSL
jgi:NAD/NADP transhydrogenase alpha subunit